MSAEAPNIDDVKEEEVIEDERVKLFRATQPETLIYRSAEGEHGVVEGLVVPYDEWVEVDSIFEGHFMESFAPGSMRKTIMERSREVRMYFDHGRHKDLGKFAVADLDKTWEAKEGTWYRANLLRGLPEFFLDGLRKGLYGASVGAEAIRTLYRRNPGKSAHNPEGLEERVRQEVRAYDYSITPRPYYASATAVMRSFTDDFMLEPYIEEVRKDKDRVLQLFRALLAEDKPEEPAETPVEDQPEAEPEPEESEPPHSEPDPPAEPAEVEASRDTQTPIDYLKDESEEAWRL